MQEHASLIKEQDKELDKLGDAVGRVKTLGKIMNDELAEQNVILEELESDVERADTGMQTMQKHTGRGGARSEHRVAQERCRARGKGAAGFQVVCQDLVGLRF